jgi:hypothetical protein
LSALQDLRQEADYLSLDGLVALIDNRLQYSVLEINVAGHVFTTSRATIAKGNEHLQSLVLPEGRNTHLDVQGRPFVDVNPAAFQGVLQFLRLGWIPLQLTQGIDFRGDPRPMPDLLVLVGANVRSMTTK